MTSSVNRGDVEVLREQSLKDLIRALKQVSKTGLKEVCHYLQEIKNLIHSTINLPGNICVVRFFYYADYKDIDDTNKCVTIFPVLKVSFYKQNQQLVD